MALLNLRNLTLSYGDPPLIDGIRIDHAVAEGHPVSPHYDPMLAKVIAYGRDRDEARRAVETLH